RNSSATGSAITRRGVCLRPGGNHGSPPPSFLDGLPAPDDAKQHAQSYLERASIADVSTLADADARVEGDRAFDDVVALIERHIEEMSVELQTHGRRQMRHQGAQRVAAAQLIGGADIGDGAAAKMLCLQQFSDEQ